MGDVELQITHTDTNGLSSYEVNERRVQYGFNEIKDNAKKWPEILWNQVYGEHWYPNNIPGMMWVAIIVALAIQDWVDAGVVLMLHAFNSGLGFYETLKANDAVAALKDALAPSCNTKRDGEWVKIPARELVPGDLVILKIGDVVPADGILCEGGTMDLDQSGLTGESLPVKKVPGDICFSGTVVKRGEQDMVVTATGERTEIGKGVALIQSVDSKGQVEIIMNRITLFLVIFALVINVILIVISLADTSVLMLCESGEQDDGALGDGCSTSKSTRILSNLVVLVIATIPIATPVVVTATMAIGARRMAEQSAVVTRLSAIEELAGMTVLCSDKTGTLTKNVLTIDDPHLINAPDRDYLIFKAALAAKAVDPDAIDKCVLEAVRDPTELKKYEVTDFLPFDPVAKRTEATVKSPDGTVFKTSKGAPQVMVDLTHNAEEVRPIVQAAMEAFAARGLRPVGVCETNENGDWVFLGLISLFDPPRDDTQDTIERALALGSSVKMVTGDHLLIAKETCRRLGMGDAILQCSALEKDRNHLRELVETVDGFAEVFPEHKFDIVALYQENGHITGMTGDGVNDAPALRKANVGFAVEGATPAAQGAASVILLTPGLSVIITAIMRSRKIFQRLQNYLIYRVFLSVYLLTFFFIAIAWAHLNFPTVIIIVMCVVFDLATMSLAYDKVIPSPLPNKWDLKRICILASVLGLVGVVFGIIFLAFIRHDVFGLATHQRGQKTACNYGYMLDSDHKTCVPLAYKFSNGTLVTLDVESGSAGQFYKSCALLDPTPKANGNSRTPEECQRDPTYDNCLAADPYYVCNLFGTLNNPNQKDQYINTVCPCSPYYYYNADKVPHTYNLEEDYENPLEPNIASPFRPRVNPYSQSVENSAVFLAISLIAQMAVFITRVDYDWFFKRRPGYVLLAIMLSEMIGTTIVVAAMRKYQFWSTGVSTAEYYIRLTRIDGAYIGIAWFYAIIAVLVMESAKMFTLHVYKLSDWKKVEAEKKRKAQETLRRRLATATSRRGTVGSQYRHQSISIPRSRGGTASSGKKPAAAKAAAGGGVDLKEPLLGASYS